MIVRDRAVDVRFKAWSRDRLLVNIPLSGIATFLLGQIVLLLIYLRTTSSFCTGKMEQKQRCWQLRVWACATYFKSCSKAENNYYTNMLSTCFISTDSPLWRSGTHHKSVWLLTKVFLGSPLDVLTLASCHVNLIWYTVNLYVNKFSISEEGPPLRHLRHSLLHYCWTVSSAGLCGL